MSTATAVAWSPKAARPARARRRPGTPVRPPLLEIPGEYIEPVEDVMKELGIEGQRAFKEDMHRALEDAHPGPELAYTVVSWLLTKFLVVDTPGFAEKLQRLPQLHDESEDLTLEQFAKSIGL